MLDETMHYVGILHEISCLSTACGYIHKAQFIWGGLYPYHPSVKVKFSL